MNAVDIIFIITALQIWGVCQLYMIKNIVRGARWFIGYVTKDLYEADKE